MRKLKLIFAVGLIAALCLAAVGCGETRSPATKTSLAYVESVTLKYNGETLRDSPLRLDKHSSGHIFSAEVLKKGEVSGDVEFASSNPSVASISAQGEMEVTGVGETIISATSVADESKTDLIVVEIIPAAAEEYKITVLGGKANVPSAAAGTIVTVTADKLTGRTFAGWTFDKENLWINGNIFKMPDADVTVTAHYDTLSYNLYVEGAVAQVDGETVGETVPYGTEVTLAPTAAPEGKSFANWLSEETLEITDNKFIMPAYDVSISASYDFIDYEISVTDGSYEGAPHFGETVVLSLSENAAIPDGKMHVGWKGVPDDDTILYGKNSFTMPAKNLAISPVYARAKTVELSSYTDTGAGRPQIEAGRPTQINGLPGKIYPIDATAAAGSFFRIRGGGILCDRDKVAQVTLTNAGDFDIVAEYVLEFLGDVSRTTGRLTVPAKGQVTGMTAVKAIPKENAPYGETPFAHVIIHEDINGNYGEIIDLGISVLEADAEDSAETPRKLTVTDGSYAIAGNYIGNAAYAGDTVLLTPEEKTDMRLTGWSCNDETVVIENNSFIMPDKDVMVTGQYEQIVYYTVTVAGGTASAARAETGTQVTLTPIVPEGHKFKEWKVTAGGVTITDNAFIMPAADVSVEAVFEKLSDGTYSLTVTNGTYTGFPQEGQPITLKINADAVPAGKMHIGWRGINEDGSASYGLSSFIMPARNLTVEPVFADAKAVDLTTETDGGTVGKPGPAGSAVEINGLNGCRYKIDATKNAGYMFRIRKGGLATDADKIAEVVLRNNGSYDLTIEYYLEFLGSKLGTTGTVTVKKGETLICYMLVNKFEHEGKAQAPYPAVTVISDIGGSAGETVDLDICVREAAIPAV